MLVLEFSATVVAMSGTPVCPSCDGIAVHRSHRKWFEYVIALFGFYPYRCEVCRGRFIARRER
jgi:hypothetical protein